MIDTSLGGNDMKQYFDKNGREITEGCQIKYPCGRVETVYRTEKDLLGIDATNKHWIETGRAVPCEYGIYPFSKEVLQEVEVI